jgi:hypothetical protein
MLNLKFYKMKIEGKNLDTSLKQQLNIGAVISSPIELEPVLAEIEHINDLGKSTWYEVVYFDGNWRCYAGSRTFKDGERVIKWKYAKDCL